ncbi:MAG: hypothetical protein ACI3W8_00320 [Oscillospiraceae bacterium]
MKKFITFILALACVLGLVNCSATTAEKPYNDLATPEISYATVHLIPPDKTIQIEDIDELVGLLDDVVIYEEDNSYTEYAGQGVTFALTMADGSQTNIMAYNPFLVIDGVGYKTEYEPCEALNAYANRLLNSENAAVILEEPPALTVVSNQTAMSALLGTYSWQRKNADGTFTGIEADSPHPLDCKDLLPPFETMETTATLTFTEEPDAILSVQCWSDENWADTHASSETVNIKGNTIELKPGGYIYQITAQWNTESGYGGTAHYFVYIKTA